MSYFHKWNPVACIWVLCIWDLGLRSCSIQFVHLGEINKISISWLSLTDIDTRTSVISHEQPLAKKTQSCRSPDLDSNMLCCQMAIFTSSTPQDHRVRFPSIIPFQINSTMWGDSFTGLFLWNTVAPCIHTWIPWIQFMHQYIQTMMKCT